MIATILVFISGISEGFNQAYLFHFAKVQAKFPSLKPNNEAWKNKYKADLKTPKFFGSTTFLVWTTDPYHFTRMVSRILFLFGFILIGNEFTEIWKASLVGFLTYITIWTGGFHLVYSIIFK